MNDENKSEEKEGNKGEGKNTVGFPLRIPKQLLADIGKSAKEHYRSANGEILAAIESYLKDWKNKH